MINRRCRLCPCGVVSSYSSSNGLSNRRFDGNYRTISAGGARCPLSKCRILFMATRWTRDSCDTALTPEAADGYRASSPGGRFSSTTHQRQSDYRSITHTNTNAEAEPHNKPAYKRNDFNKSLLFS